jgi:O-antigen/teichoic acid export membrane protein
LSDTKKYSRNVIANWSNFLVSLAVAFTVSPIVVHKLGDLRYGIWSLVVSITGYYGYLDLGLQSGVGHYISRYLADKNADKLNATVNTSFTALCVMGTIAFAISLGIAVWFPHFVKVPAEEANSVRMAMVILGFGIGLRFPFALFQSILGSAQRFDVLGGIAIVNRTASAGIMLLALHLGYGFITLSIITAATQLCEGFALRAFALRAAPTVDMRLFRFNRPAFKEIVNYGTFTFLTNALLQLGAILGPFLVGRSLDAVAVTYFSIPNNLLPYMSSVISSATSPILQIIIPLDVKQQVGKIRDLYTLGTRYIGALTLLAGVNVLVVGGPFIGRWMGEKYLSGPYGSSGSVMAILVIGQIASGFAAIPTQILYGRRKNRGLTAIVAGDVVCRFLLAAILVKPFGMLGVAFGMTLPVLITQGVLLPWYAARVVEAPFAPYWSRSVLPGVVCAGGAYAIVKLTLGETVLAGWPAIFGAAAFTSVCYLLLAYFIILERPYREALWALVLRKGIDRSGGGAG